MTKVKRKAISLMLVAVLLFSMAPEVPAMAAKGAKNLADCISNIVVTESSIIKNETGDYPLDAVEPGIFVVAVTASGSDAAREAWASASNAEKASISNATSSDAGVAIVGEITEDNFTGVKPSGEELTGNEFWLEVRMADGAKPGWLSTITVNVGGEATSFVVVVPTDDPGPPAPTNPTVKITSANGKSEEDQVEAGKTLQLTASITPEDVDFGPVEWYSSVPGVATVDQNGLITALSAGLTTVGIRIDGQNWQGASISILVIPAEPPVVLTKSIELYIKGEMNTVGVGESRDIYASALPYNVTNRKLDWTSSDPTVAKVEPSSEAYSTGAAVTGLKAGTVTITAAATDGSGVSESITFEVLDIEKVTKVTINRGKKIRIRLDRELSPIVTTEPQNAVGLTQTWESSDPEILEAGTGWIYARNVGNATLSVTIKGITATCDVEVWAQQLELALSRTQITLQEGAETKVNAVITKPDLGQMGMTQWKSSNPEVLEITEGVDLWAMIKAKSTGTAVLTATLDGKEATCNVTVTKDAVTPTPADKIDAVLEENLDALYSGTVQEKENAVATIFTTVQSALKDIKADAISSDDMTAVVNLENIILGAMSDKFTQTQLDSDRDVALSVNEIKGAVLNLPIDWPTTEPVHAVLKIANADTTGLKLPAGVTGAQAFDIKLDAVSGTRTQSLTTLDVPVEISMAIPDEFLEADNLWVYNFHDGRIIKIKPTVQDGEMTIRVKEFSTFVLMDIPSGSSGGGSSSSGGSGSYSVRNNNLSGQWIQDSAGWWFKKSTGGYPQNTWAKINNKWYHFDTAGYMQTSWLLLNNSWYYLKDQGDMASKEWVNHNGTWYYLHENGTMMSNQWFLYNGGWYYMNQDGAMLVNTITPDGYKVNASGIWEK